MLFEVRSFANINFPSIICNLILEWFDGFGMAMLSEMPSSVLVRFTAADAASFKQAPVGASFGHVIDLYAHIPICLSPYTPIYLHAYMLMLLWSHRWRHIWHHIWYHIWYPIPHMVQAWRLQVSPGTPDPFWEMVLKQNYNN